MDFSIRKLMPHVYHLDFDTQYELTMHFLRAQEYYESPKFYKKIFPLLDYMDWYSKVHGKGSFSYTRDWSGFNTPSWALTAVYNSETYLPDRNRYDKLMGTLVDRICYEEEGHTFYFIGTFAGGGINKKGEKDDILAHEIAHALYTVNSEYSDKVDELLNARYALGDEYGEYEEHEPDPAAEVLIDMGYHSSTIQDEIHAYCATGLCEKLKGVITKKEMKPFQKLFKEYKKKCAA